jgi:glycosyltransferase involved in cell wall biosynthesis
VVDTVVPGETGVLFPAGDIDRLTAHVVDLVEDNEARIAMGREARRRAERRSWAEVFHDLFALYGDLARDRDRFVTTMSAFGTGVTAKLDGKDPDAGG